MEEHLLVPVVAGENHDGVLAEAEGVELVEEFTEVAIELQQAVGKFAVTTRPGILVAGHDWDVHQRVVEIQEERPPRASGVLHESEGPTFVLDVDVAPRRTPPP